MNLIYTPSLSSCPPPPNSLTFFRFILTLASNYTYTYQTESSL